MSKCIVKNENGKFEVAEYKLAEYPKNWFCREIKGDNYSPLPPESCFPYLIPSNDIKIEYIKYQYSAVELTVSVEELEIFSIKNPSIESVCDIMNFYTENGQEVQNKISTALRIQLKKVVKELNMSSKKIVSLENEIKNLKVELVKC